MRCAALALVIACSVGVTPALALDAPKAGPSDPRIKVVDYDPWGVVKVTGVFRTATEILLADDETILHVAVGDTTGWDVVAEKNILFIKPKAARGPTNLIVTSQAPSGERHYTFELSTRGGSSSRQTRDTVFMLRFRYPQAEKARTAAVVTAAQTALENRLVQLKLDRAAVEGPRNLAYSLQGASELEPSEVSDNGRFTVLRFPGNQPLPAVYEVEGDGTETLAAFDARGEFLVIHDVVRALRLRRGRQLLCIYNDAFDPHGRQAATGTAASDVERTDKEGGNRD